MVNFIAATYFHRLYKDQSGVMAILLATLLPAMLGFMALALDLPRGYMAGAEIQNAATAASISSAIESGDSDAAKRYFIANLPSGLHSITYDYDTDVELIVNGSSVSVRPHGFDIPSFFPLGDVSGSANGGSMIQVGSISTVGMPTAQIVPADYFFITDVSGSMAAGDSVCPNGQPCSRMTAVKQSSINLINTIANSQNAAQNYGISLTAWTTSVTGYFPVTTDFAFALAQTNALLFPQGATCGACGLIQANALIPSSTQGRQKIAMFLTDGSMNVSPNGSDPFTAAANACVALKQQPDVSVWAITFGQDAINNPANVTLRNTCASNMNQSIHVANGQELNNLFGQIFLQTGNLRVTQ